MAAAMHAQAIAEAEAAAAAAPKKKSIGFFGMFGKGDDTKEGGGGEVAVEKKKGIFSGMFGRK